VTTEYQTFRGASVSEALSHVRETFGTDALIASTHEWVQEGSALPMVEILAAAPPRSERPRMASLRPSESPARASARPRPSSMPVRKSKPSEVELGRELNEARRLLEEFARVLPASDRVRALLSAVGLEGDVASELAERAVSNPHSETDLGGWLQQELSQRLVFRGGLIEQEGPCVIACVGPTGVGKTTTLAKLAACATQALRRSVGAISLDTFRVGALEQWQRFAELIGLDFAFAENVGTFHRIIHAHDHDLWLIDVAGGNGPHQANLLHDCLQGLPGVLVETLLVLPAWLRARDAERLALSVPEVTGIVISKMDETDQIGGVLQAALSRKIPLTYLCHGPRIPEDIREATLDEVLADVFSEHT
jgi:flagellar biosynthesis protein FlhF